MTTGLVPGTDRFAPPGRRRTRATSGGRSSASSVTLVETTWPAWHVFDPGRGPLAVGPEDLHPFARSVPVGHRGRRRLPDEDVVRLVEAVSDPPERVQVDDEVEATCWWA
jgi:hypothetical protein